MLDQRLFLSLSGKFCRFACAVFFATAVSAVTTAQTLVTGSLTGTPLAGEYYHPVGITLSPNFSFTATPGSILHLYISSVACNPLSASLSQDRNYTVTYTPRVAGVSNPADPNNSTCQVMQTVQYFDGLGRPLQTVQVKGSPGGMNDIVQPVAYDAFGREAVKYLPYTTGGTLGSYRPDALNTGAGVFSFYNPNGNGQGGAQQASGVVVIQSPYAQTVFEPSPLNRPLEQGAPGDPWQPGQDINSDHTIRMEYGTNAVSGDYAVRMFSADAVTTAGHGYERTLGSPGNYDAGQLYLTLSKDENWQGTDGLVGQTHEYKDKEGHVVLKRTFNSGGQVLSTYYVYDDFGNLSFVLPPGASPDGGAPGQTVLDNFCYQYRYDGRNRLIEKKLPGKGWEFMVYNTLDQVVMIQDPNQRNQSPQQWTFTKYDGVGRTVMTGLWNYGSSQASAGYDNGGRLWLENYYNTTAEQKWETRDDATSTGYNNQSTPLGTGYTFLTINYYDDYTFPGSGTFGPAAPNTGAGQSSSVQGLLTGSKVNILGTGTMLLAMDYYDDKGRPVQSKSQNHLGGQDIVSNTYDFTNQLLSSTRSHVAYGATTTIDNRYVYDHMGRKLEAWQKINSDGEVQLSALQYNEVGQLKTKTLGGGLQATGYAYNERGWLNTANSSGNLFNLDLRYNSPDAGVQQQWNGNISQMNYQGNNSGFKQFSYSYDRLNRLTYAQSSNNLLNEGISYDAMGNITQLDRGGAGMGSLYYTSYTGNQLNTVTGYSPRNYAYDPNGNTTSDGQGRGIEYSLLNLPQRLTQPGNNNTLATYTYDAAGNKLRNTGSDGSWDYVGGIVYHNNNIELISTEEGRAVPRGGGSYSYQYYLKDHLGNTRVSFDRAGSGQAYVLQEDEYYSFGLRKPLFDASSNNRYLYNGKEVQIDLANQYDYGARFYDPVVGRWERGSSGGVREKVVALCLRVQ